VIIETPSRLHFGIVNINNINYPLYKCAGCAIQEPRLVASFEENDELIIEGINRRELIERFIEYAKEFNKKVKFRILSEIPSHAGLGSTTQICLSFSYSLHNVNKKYFDPYKEAKKLKLGNISGIGIAAFINGGFIIDSGKNKDDDIANVEFRCNFPEDWVFLLILDKRLKKGLSEEVEYEIIKRLPATRKENIEEMYDLLQSMKDAMKEKDIEKFGKSLTRFQYLVGFNFKEAQGGIFSSPIIQEYVDFLLKNGAYGAGQSSWGPLVYALYQKDNLKINILKEKLSKDVEIKIAIADNYGYRIKKI
jgi:beta-ribofuranosylaminobenzene 5'-phosphate synthase